MSYQYPYSKRTVSDMVDTVLANDHNKQENQIDAITSFVGDIASDSIIESNTTKTVTSNTTLSNNDRTVLVDASGGNVTITLPTALSAKQRIYTIKKVDSSTNTVTIDGNGSETIDGNTTYVLTGQYL